MSAPPSGECLALSRVVWPLEIQGHRLEVSLSAEAEAFGSPSPSDPRWRDLPSCRLFGEPIKPTDAPQTPLLWRESPSPFDQGPLQLREQSDLVLRVSLASPWPSARPASSVPSGTPSFRLSANLAPPFFLPYRITPPAGLFAGRLHLPSYVGILSLELWSEGTEPRKIWTLTVDVRPSKLQEADEFRLLLQEIASVSLHCLLQEKSPVYIPLSMSEEAALSLRLERLLLLQELLAVKRLRALFQKLREETTDLLFEEKKRLPLPSAPPRKTEDIARAYREGLPLQPSLRPLRLPPKARNFLPRVIRRHSLALAPSKPEIRFIAASLSHLAHLVRQIRTRLSERPSHPLEASFATIARTLQEGLASGPWAAFVSTPPPMPSPLPRLQLQAKKGTRELLDLWDKSRRLLSLRWPLLDAAVEGPLREISKLYEIWCFLQLWSALASFASPLDDLVSFFEQSPEDAILRASPKLPDFRFSYRGSLLCLSYQRMYPPGLGPFSSYSVPFTPDFSLTILGDEIRILCFDAKYRPLGAVEKMHTYRDALHAVVSCILLWPASQEADPQPVMYRPAFESLIPGVGSFPLRPSSPSRARLSDFLRSLLDPLCTKGAPLTKKVDRF